MDFMMFRLMSWFCAALLVVSTAARVNAATFTDVNGLWSQPAIENLSSLGVLSGYQDDTFRPNATLTRAEFAAVISKALRLGPASAMSPASFGDVSSTHWASPAIGAVVQKGLMSGYPGGAFKPNATISRAETLAVLVKAAAFSPVEAQQAQHIVDAASGITAVPQWAVPAVAVALNQGVIGATVAPSMSNLSQPSTRGDVAFMLNQLVTNRSDNAVKLSINPAAAGNNPLVVMTPPPVVGKLVPSNTTFTAKLDSSLASNLVKLDDALTLTLPNDVLDAANNVLIPAGSKVMAKVTKVSPAGRAGKSGMIELDFEQLVLPNAKAYDIDASLAPKETSLDGDSGLKRTGKFFGKTAIGAGVGAAAGTAIAPLAKGDIAKGAIYGTAIGAGAGAATALIQTGKDIQLPAGTPLVLTLNQAVRVDASQQ
jgi:hypothetical protein